MERPSDIESGVVGGIDALFQRMKIQSLDAIECAKCIRHIENAMGYYKRSHLREDDRITFTILLDVPGREDMKFDAPAYEIASLLTKVDFATRHGAKTIRRI